MKNYLSKNTKLIFLANHEHHLYEFEHACFMYLYRTSDSDEMFIHLNSSKNHIDSAIEKLKEVELDKLDENTIYTVTEDIKRWTYYSLQLKSLHSSTKADVLYSSGRLDEAYDQYNLAIQDGLKLLSITKDYINYLEPNYIRIAKSNYLMNISKYNSVYSDLLYKHNNNEDILIKVVDFLWQSYNNSYEALLTLPEAKSNSDIMNAQYKFMREILNEHKDRWGILINHFKENDKLLKLFQDIDGKYYKKLVKSNQNDWEKETFVILVIFVCLTVLVSTIFKFYGTLGAIISFFFSISIFIIVVLVILILKGKISENNFTKIITAIIDKLYDFMNLFFK